MISRCWRYLAQRLREDPAFSREYHAGLIVATQAREGIRTTLEQARVAYDNVQKEKGGSADGK